MRLAFKSCKIARLYLTSSRERKQKFAKKLVQSTTRKLVIRSGNTYDIIYNGRVSRAVEAFCLVKHCAGGVDVICRDHLQFLIDNLTLMPYVVSARGLWKHTE